MMRKIGNDGKDGVVWKGGVAVNGGGWWFGWWPQPLGHRVALTLALSRRAGEGTVVTREVSATSRGGSCCGMGVG